MEEIKWTNLLREFVGITEEVKVLYIMFSYALQSLEEKERNFIP